MVSIMSATRRRTSGVVGSGTGSARRARTGWPMRAILRIAMAGIWDCRRGPSKGCGHGDGQSQGLLLGTRPSAAHLEKTAFRHKEPPLQIIVRDNNIDQALKA